MTTKTWTTAILLCALGGARVEAQTQYYNLDALRPTRIEDAVAAERYALEGQLAPLRFERMAGGAYRWRSEPRLTYGILPATEISVRVPVLLIQPRAAGATNTLGFSGVALGGGHAFTIERAAVPALALAGEVLIPAGEMAAPNAAYAIKGLLTKTTPWGRAHLNVSVGNYSAPGVKPAETGCPLRTRYRIPGTCAGQGGGIPVIIDLPCRVAPAAAEQMTLARCAPPDLPPIVLPDTDAVPPIRGKRWVAGLAVDHAFALHSTAVIADIYAEHFIGLYSAIDWTAEAGVRHQLGPQLVVDFGASSHFAGVVRTNGATLGATYYMPLRRAAGLVRR